MLKNKGQKFDNIADKIGGTNISTEKNYFHQS